MSGVIGKLRLGKKGGTFFSNNPRRGNKSTEIKKLIRQIRGILPAKEKKKDEKLLILFKDLSAMLETGEFSYPAGIQELMNLQLRHSHSPLLENKPPVNEKN